MTALIVIGCILLFFIFILSLRANITVAYNGETILSVRVLCFKYNILPSAKKDRGPHSMSRKKAEKLKAKLEKKEEKKLAKRKAKAAAKAEKKRAKKEGTAPKESKSLSEILDIIELVKDLLSTVVKKFFGHLRIDVARIKLKIAMGDAAATAIAYGAVTQSINLFFPILEGVKNFKMPKERDLDIQADFLSEKSEIDICFIFKLRVWHLLHVALAALLRFIGHKIKSMDKQSNTEGHITSKDFQAQKNK